MKGVVAIIVVYYPDCDKLIRLIAEIGSVADIIVVDNTDSESARLAYERLRSSFSYVAWLQNNNNVGIATAQQMAVTIAAKERYEFAIFFDQDSLLLASELSKLRELAGQINAVDGGKFMAIGPQLVDQASGRSYPFRLSRQSASCFAELPCVRRVEQLNSSGMLFVVDAWLAAGGNDTSLFIDHVDTEWAFRIASLGYHIYGAENVFMQHSMGEQLIKPWLFFGYGFVIRSPLRHYYLFRNSVILQKRRYVPLRWKAMNIVKLLFTVAVMLCVDKRRVAQARMMAHGFVHGVKSVGGVFR